MFKYFKAGDHVVIVYFDMATMTYSLNKTKGVVLEKRQKYFTVELEDGKKVEFEMKTSNRNEIGHAGNGWMENCKAYLSEQDLEDELYTDHILTPEVKRELYFKDQLELAKHIRETIKKKGKNKVDN